MFFHDMDDAICLFNLFITFNCAVILFRISLLFISLSNNKVVAYKVCLQLTCNSNMHVKSLCMPTIRRSMSILLLVSLESKEISKESIAPCMKKCWWIERISHLIHVVFNSKNLLFMAHLTFLFLPGIVQSVSSAPKIHKIDLTTLSSLPFSFVCCNFVIDKQGLSPV